MSARRVFDEQHYEALNSARGHVVLRLLGDLQAPLDLRTAADVGCGVGYFSAFLNKQGLAVAAIDGREANVQEGKRRYPELRFITANIERAEEVSSLGAFDLALCFGLLYHLENPFRAIRNLRSLTGKVLLVESMCAPGGESSMELLDEFRAEDQGLNYVAFYPTEACLVKMLYRAGFSFVYGLLRPPEHPDFHASRSRRKARTMLVASSERLTCSGLALVAEPSRPWDIWPTPKLWRLWLRRLAKMVGMLRPQPVPSSHARKV